MIHMQQSLTELNALPVSWLLGNAELIEKMIAQSLDEPFSDSTTEFLNVVSGKIISDKAAKSYPDVITFGFWIRKANILALKRRFTFPNNSGLSEYRIGRGIVFHIAPSNVPVNFAYSLAMGLLCGNSNIVRVPSKNFPQVDIIVCAIEAAIKQFPSFAQRVVLVRYGHEKKINDIFSSISDVRVVWGGDSTISELRESALPPRATEVNFADRYSLAVIEADFFLESADWKKTALDFYNDTYLTDQNACTSPRLVAWTGKRIDEAKQQFWTELHKIVSERYEIQGVQAVNKLTESLILMANGRFNAHTIKTEDNLIIRISVSDISSELMDFMGNSGYFFEYDFKDIHELKDICNDTRCQTVSYLGKSENMISLVKSEIKGIDRIVPMGHTMDFDLIWDGYDLVERLSRVVSVL